MPSQLWMLSVDLIHCFHSITLHLLQKLSSTVECRFLRREVLFLTDLQSLISYLQSTRVPNEFSFVTPVFLEAFTWTLKLPMCLQFKITGIFKNMCWFCNCTIGCVHNHIGQPASSCCKYAQKQGQGNLMYNILQASKGYLGNAGPPHHTICGCRNLCTFQSFGLPMFKQARFFPPKFFLKMLILLNLRWIKCGHFTPFKCLFHPHHFPVDCIKTADDKLFSHLKIWNWLESVFPVAKYF